MSDFQSQPFGKYLLTSCLKEGKYSETYQAKTYGAKGFEKRLLIQKIKPIAKETKGFLPKLMEELQKAVKVSHPNVVSLFDFGCVTDEYFLSHESFDAVTFADWMSRLQKQDEKLPPEMALYVMSEVLKGLHAIHSKLTSSQALVHANIQPNMLVISREGEVKIQGLGFEKVSLQFGISENASAYHYDPVQKRSGQFRPQTDIFLSGLVLFELMVGKPLMAMVPEDSGRDRIDMKFLEKHVPEDVALLIKQALADKIEDRFASALDMSAEIQRILYSEYPEFSSLQISQMIQRLFPYEEPEPDAIKGEDTLRELVKSSQNQVNFVHREGTEYSQLLADTVAIDRNELKKFFPETESVVAEPSQIDLEDYEETDAGVEDTQDSILQSDLKDDSQSSEEGNVHSVSSRKSKEPGEGTLQKFMGPFKTSRWVFVPIAALILVISVLAILSQFLPQRGPHTHTTNELPAVYQLLIESHPTGAQVWWNGEDSGKVTPAQFDDLKVNEIYDIVLKKPGYEDYHESHQNTAVRDQVMDITLRPGS